MSLRLCSGLVALASFALLIAPQPPGWADGKLVPSVYGSRSGAIREKLLRDGGGNARSEAAVAAGLQWLSRHQAQDGHWSLDDFHTDGKCNCKDRGQKDDTLATGLALLPFLGSGETHKAAGKDKLYGKTVERGLKWLIAKQQGDGKMGENTLAHALATTAVCEAYGMTADPALKGPAQRAISYLASQQKKDGNWEGTPKGAGPGAAQGGWHITAMRAGHIADLNVPVAYFEQVLKLLDAQAKEKEPAPAALAAYILCRHYMGWGTRHPDLQKSIEHLFERRLDGKTIDFEYYYFAACALHRQRTGGPPLPDGPWETWNPKMRDLLIDAQDQGLNPDFRDQKGSWSPTGDRLAPYGGRLMETALGILTLEVYYR